MSIRTLLGRSPFALSRPRGALLAALTLSLLGGAGCGETPPTKVPTPEPAKTAAPVASAAPLASASAAAGAPKAEPESSITLEQLLDVARSSGASAIDADNFIYLSDVPGTSQIFAPPVKGDPLGTPKQLTSYPDRVGSLRVLPGGERALFMKDSGGDENDQIFLMDLKAGGEPLALTEAPKVKHTAPVFDEKGASIAFTSNARNGKDMDLYVEALPARGAKAAEKKGEPAKRAPVVELSGSHSVQDFRGDKVIVIEVRSSFDQDLWIVDRKTKKKELLTKHTGDERYDWARFSRDGKAVLTLTDAGREYLSLVAIDIASGKRTPIIEEGNDVVQAASARAGALAKGLDPKAEDVIVFVINKDGVEELATATLDKARKVLKRAPVNLSGVFGSMDMAPGGAAAYVTLDRSNLPSEVFRIDVAAATAARQTFTPHGGIDETKLVDAELVPLKTFDGKTISFFWYKAAGASDVKRPVILMIHGGPEGQWQPGWSALTQYFALHGYSVAAPNVRGSTGYGKSFAHLDDKEKREDSVKDLSEVGKFLAARPDVDGSKLVLFGGSYGGYMVLAGLTLYPEQWAAGVDVVGIANFRTFLEQTAPYRRALREAEYGSLAADGAFLDRVSPISRVDKIRAPLFVIHGTRDPRVPVGEARQISEALKKRNVPVELMTFDDEGHGLAKRKNRITAYPAVAAFLDKYVKNKK